MKSRIQGISYSILEEVRLKEKCRWDVLEKLRYRLRQKDGVSSRTFSKVYNILRDNDKYIIEKKMFGKNGSYHIIISLTNVGGKAYSNLQQYYDATTYLTKSYLSKSHMEKIGFTYYDKKVIDELKSRYKVDIHEEKILRLLCERGFCRRGYLKEIIKSNSTLQRVLSRLLSLHYIEKAVDVEGLRLPVYKITIIGRHYLLILIEKIFMIINIMVELIHINSEKELALLKHEMAAQEKIDKYNKKILKVVSRKVKLFE